MFHSEVVAHAFGVFEKDSPEKSNSREPEKKPIGSYLQVGVSVDKPGDDKRHRDRPDTRLATFVDGLLELIHNVFLKFFARTLDWDRVRIRFEWIMFSRVKTHFLKSKIKTQTPTAIISF